jgi:hypothetical protein
MPTLNSRTIQIPKGAQLAHWTVRRILVDPDSTEPRVWEPGPGNTIPADWIEMSITIHAGLRRWMEQLATDTVETGQNTSAAVNFARFNNRHQPQVIEPLDGGGLWAWNLEYSGTVPRHFTPSMRFDQPWHVNLGFLRLMHPDNFPEPVTAYLTRKFRVRMTHPGQHEEFWETDYDTRVQKDRPMGLMQLERAMEQLKTQHYQHPKVNETTVTIATD